MKPKNGIKIRFQRAAANTNPQMDKVVLEDVLTAYRKTLGRKSTNPQLKIWRIILKSPITKLAAAAVVVTVGIVVVGSYFTKEDLEKGPANQLQSNKQTNAITSEAADITKGRSRSTKELSLSAAKAGLPGALDAEQTVAKSPLIYKLRLTRILEDLQGKVFRHNDTAEREILIEAEVLRVFKGDPKAAGQRVVLVWDTVRSGPRLYSCLHAEQVLPKHVGSAKAVYLMALTPTEPATDAEGRPRLKNIFCLDIMGTRVSKADVDPKKWATAKKPLERLRLELLSALDDPDANTRHSAIKGLRRWDGQKLSEEPPGGPLWKDERAAARILAASRDPDWRVRWVVAWMIPKEAGEEGEKALVHLLSDTHREVRQVAAFVLRRRGREDLVKPLLDEPLAREANWGEAVEGLAVRLRPNGATTAKRVTLLVDAHNDGPGTYRGTRSTHGCWLKVDGKWYGRVNTRERVAPMRLKAGDRQLVFTQIRLSSEKNHLWRGGISTNDGLVPPPLTVTVKRNQSDKQLELNPGRHSVRLAMPTNKREGKTYAYSNPVEIEILPKEKPAEHVDRKKVWDQEINALRAVVESTAGRYLHADSFY